jgi:transposase
MINDLETYSKSELIALLKGQQQALQTSDEQLARKQQALQSSEDLLAQKEQLIAKAAQQLLRKEARIAELERLLYGQKRERFVGDPNQAALPFEPDTQQQQQDEAAHEQKISYVRKKQARANHKGRVPLPAHLPVEDVHIYPEGDLDAMVCMGKEITEELECRPAQFYIKRYIRYKYASKAAGNVVIAEPPERVIDKGIPGPGLLATILVDKYMDHLPLYRQRQRFLRENIPMAASTLDGWAAQAMDRLEILYQHLVRDTKTRGYLQVDETPIKVLEHRKKGGCHQGYYWVYYSPIARTVVFDYQPTRGAPGAEQMLDDFSGYLQTDGYGVYTKIGARPEVTHLACWAHARREFVRALDNDEARAQAALTLIQGLYAVERTAREQALSPGQRKQLRLDQALPILNQLGKWIHAETKNVLPKSRIGKALSYSAARWDALSAYLYDGTLEIDNNRVENAIRPVALGRKNYLFAGSHKAARRAAMVYSLLGCCKLHEVNPYEWLRHTLQHIMSTKYNDLRKLYPQHYQSKV